MGKYNYRAQTTSGEKVSGTYEATSREEVLAMITSNGYYPLLVEEVKQSADINIGFAQKVGLTDISVFCRQFYTMLDAGVTINSALNILSHQLPNKRLREVVKLVEESVSKGETLSEGMRRHLDVFPPLLVSMIEVGEASGNLDSIMERMSTQYEKENKINNKVKSAMIYPIILGIVAVGVVIFILTFVMPTFITMFTDEGIDLPITTRMLISASDFLQANIIYLALVGAVLGFSIRLYSKTESGQYTFSHLKLKVPVIKALNEKI
ncbi:MAG: type II secretion system F family protein, partial [Turicibacter sp.]